MDRLLKLVHSKAAEERLVEVTSSSSTYTNVEKVIYDKNDTKAIRETENDKNEEKVTSSKEENDVKVKDKIEKEAVEIDKGIETNQITESGEKFETFGEAGSSEKKESKANAKTNAENKKEETKAKIETDADKSKAKTNVNRQLAIEPIVMNPNTERKTEKTKSCIGKKDTGEDTGDNTDVCDSDDLFEEEERSRVMKRAGSTGQQDFFEKAYPILYEPLTSCSSIYDPSQGSSNDPFHPGFGGKPTSSVGSSTIPDLSEITLCEGTHGGARGKGFKRLKDYLKRNRDFQEYSDYIFVENMCKAEDESPAATPTSLKVSFCIFNKIFLIPILPHTCCIFYLEPYSWQNSDCSSSVVCFEGNAYFMEKSLNENGCSFDILDKKEFARKERGGGGRRQL